MCRQTGRRRIYNLGIGKKELVVARLGSGAGGFRRRSGCDDASEWRAARWRVGRSDYRQARGENGSRGDRRSQEFMTRACSQPCVKFHANCARATGPASNAYVDLPLEIGYGQTITEPYLVALHGEGSSNSNPPTASWRLAPARVIRQRFSRSWFARYIPLKSSSRHARPRGIAFIAWDTPTCRLGR